LAKILSMVRYWCHQYQELISPISIKEPISRNWYHPYQRLISPIPKNWYWCQWYRSHCIRRWYRSLGMVGINMGDIDLIGGLISLIVRDKCHPYRRINITDSKRWMSPISKDRYHSYWECRKEVSKGFMESLAGIKVRDYKQCNITQQFTVIHFLNPLQGRIQDFTRGGAQTCHGSWGCTDDCTLAADDHFLIVPCYHLYIFEVFKIGRKTSSDCTVIIFRGAWYDKRARWCFYSLFELKVLGKLLFENDGLAASALLDSGVIILRRLTTSSA